MTKMSVAVLGPLGTYTHEAAHQRFGSFVEFIEQTTIKDIFGAVSSTAQLGVVPQENTIFGTVLETYDVLRKPVSGFIRGEVTLQIQHCLLVRQGVELYDIQKVFSHEQALGQCQGFLTAHLPSATLVKTSSTAAAAKALLDSPANCAAIASKICVTLFDGLTVLYEGIQDEAVNFTRFYIVTKDREASFPSWLSTEPHHALVQISTKIPPSPPTENGADISQLVSALKLNVTRLDRRPSIVAVPFHDIYLVELKDTDRHKSDIGWIEEVDKAVESVGRAGGEARLVGIW